MKTAMMIGAGLAGGFIVWGLYDRFVRVKTAAIAGGVVVGRGEDPLTDPSAVTIGDPVVVPMRPRPAVGTLEGV